MSNKPLNIGEEAKANAYEDGCWFDNYRALGTMGYFQIIERLNVADIDYNNGKRFRRIQSLESNGQWGQLGRFPQILAICDDRRSL